MIVLKLKMDNYVLKCCNVELNKDLPGYDEDLQLMMKFEIFVQNESKQQNRFKTRSFNKILIIQRDLRVKT